MSVEEGDEKATLRAKLRQNFGAKDSEASGVYYFDPPQGPQAGVAIRYRPPFIQTAKHDARADALGLALDHLASKDVPLWLALLIARDFLDEYSKDLQTGEITYVDGVYDTIDASVWCREVMSKLEVFLRNFVENDKIPDGGVECASYCAAHLANCVISELESGNSKDKDGGPLIEALNVLDQRLSARCEKQHWRSGSTVVCVCLDGTRLHVAWVGDSAAGTSASLITLAHSPSVPEEAKRVEEDGGCLVWIQGELRVNGILNLTRSLGDIAGRPMISAKPDVKTLDLDGGEYICVLACDGVSDALQEEELFKLVKDFCVSHPVNEYKQLAESICAAARNSSSDNLTVVCVFLRPPEELWNLFA